MPLSTSSFNQPDAPPRGFSRGTWLLFALTALLLIGVELVSGVGFNRISRIQRRTLNDLAEARSLRPAPSGQPASALFTGNSLFLRGVDVPRFREKLGGRARTTMLPIESTGYYDFYYGLEHLFRQGMRPQFVVLCMGTTFMTSSTIRGEYSAYYLFDSQGIVEYVRKTRTHPTEASGLLFAHYSAFYGGRKEMRSYLLFRLIPGMFEMTSRLIVRHIDPPSDPEVERIFEPRLRALRELSEKYGAKFVYVIVPCMQKGEDAVIEAGRRAGVPVLLPVRNFALTPDYYTDGFHLGAEGAAIFTDALAKSFSQLIDSGSSADKAAAGQEHAASSAPQALTTSSPSRTPEKRPSASPRH